MKKTLKVLILVLFFVSSFQLYGQEALSPAKKIANVIKNTLVDIRPEKILDGMKAHFRQMNLLDASGKWRAPELEAISDQLLPGDLDKKSVKKFVDLIAQYAETNVYLNDFLNRADGQDFPVLFGKVEKEGAVTFPDMVFYALALENLTKAMRADWRIIEACQKIWVEERKKKGTLALIKRPAYFIKLESVELPITLYIQYQKSGLVPAKFCRRILPMNILEAAAFDVAKGFYGNAETGRILAKNHPGTETNNQKTGQGSTVWSADKKMVLINMPYSKQWADLYGTWNMAFISQFDACPYFYVKLLIPQVSDYELAPSEYIFNRAFALYTFLNYNYNDIGKATNWSDKKLTRLWGVVNKESSKKYEKLVLDTK